MCFLMIVTEQTSAAFAVFPDAVRRPLLLALALFSLVMLFLCKLGKKKPVMDKAKRKDVVQQRKVS